MKRDEGKGARGVNQIAEIEVLRMREILAKNPNRVRSILMTGRTKKMRWEGLKTKRKSWRGRRK